MIDVGGLLVVALVLLLLGFFGVLPGLLFPIGAVLGIIALVLLLLRRGRGGPVV